MTSTANGTATARAESSPPLLEAIGIGVNFDGVHALDDVTLKIGRQEVVGLIGPNGAGKTTLMNVLSGFQRPTRGRVLVNGVDATRWGAERTVRRGVSRTFQAVRPFPALTVFQNVELGALGVGVRRRDARERVNHILEALHISHHRNDQAGSLPHGKERRLGIARALASEPQVLLLDEPAAGANEAESDELVASLRAIKTEFSCSLVVIEHDMRLMMSICERIHVLDYGKSLAEGTPREIQNNPTVLEAYLGTAPKEA